MKRVLLSLFGIIVLVIVGVAIAVALSWSRIPDIIASKLSEKMKVRVEIDGMHVGMESIDVQKVEIGNPSGSILPKAFSAEQVLVQAPLFGYLKNNIVIDRVELHDVYVGLEFQSKSSNKGNWTTIMANMQGNTKSEGKTKRTVLIKKLILTNIDIALVYRQGGSGVKNLPRINRLEFDNISSEEGLPYEQISRIIFMQMLKSIFSIEGLQNMLQDMLLNPQNGIQNVLKPFKGLIQGSAEPEQESQEPAA